MSTPAYAIHCTGCGRRDGHPVVTDQREDTCCTCCRDADGRRGPGLNNGRGW